MSLNAPLQRVPYGFRPVLSVNACYRVLTPGFVSHHRVR